MKWFTSFMPLLTIIASWLYIVQLGIIETNGLLELLPWFGYVALPPLVQVYLCQWLYSRFNYDN